MSAGELGITSRTCQTSSVVAREVHWRVMPRVGDGVGTGTRRSRTRWPYDKVRSDLILEDYRPMDTLALQRVKVTVEPAQLRTSVAKR